MDIYCPKCAEPVDMDELHEEASYRGITFARVRREYASQGCGALTGIYGTFYSCKPANDRDAIRASVAGAAFDLLGDDIDGIASELEDYFLFNGL